ncbi:MAG: 1-deoxy-D-xylulose-5-phosphate reductoisomerase [Burkholderiaceae bacterium]
MQQITILGATGSIGMSTLDVIERHPDRYSVYALTAHRKVDELAQLCRRFRPQVAVVATAPQAVELERLLRASDLPTDVAYGENALCQVSAADACDVVMAAIVGAAGLAPTLAAARAGKKILLANKEALVMSGPLFMETAARSGARLLPVDSEHNAIFQCLPFDCAGNGQESMKRAIAKILLTASGGPFRTREIASFPSITPEEAVSHPNWVMGRKISVDSATMMNKGLEVIEAHWLFDLPADRIEVVIHPQSVIHSMVSYVDGSMLAQLGNPDMRLPIARALPYPERILPGVESIDLTKVARLDFSEPDYARFPCLKLAYDALRAGGFAPAVLNAANEIAVDAFLDRRIRFNEIYSLIERVMNETAPRTLDNIDELIEEDQRIRRLATSFLPS